MELLKDYPDVASDEQVPKKRYIEFLKGKWICKLYAINLCTEYLILLSFHHIMRVFV